MSDMFGAISTSGSGLHVYRTWMDAISDNIANANDARPSNQPAFQERFIVAQANQPGPDGIGQGASVASVNYGDSTGTLVYEPNNPLADQKGLVRYPNIDMGTQLTNLMLAQRGYEANLNVIQRAKEAYTAALEIGK